MPDTYSPMFACGWSVPGSQLLSLYRSLGREVGQQGKQKIKRGERERDWESEWGKDREREREGEWGGREGGRGLDETLTRHSCQRETESKRERERERERERDGALPHCFAAGVDLPPHTHADTHPPKLTFTHTTHAFPLTHTQAHQFGNLFFLLTFGCFLLFLLMLALTFTLVVVVGCVCWSYATPCQP